MKTFEFIVENATLIEPYFNIFNAIAVFFNDATYLEILKIAFLLGGFYAFLIAIASIFRMSLSFQNTQIAPFKKFTLLISYILGVFFLLTMSYYRGKVDVIIKTNKVDTYCSLYTKQDYHTVVTGKYKLAGGASNAVVVGNIPYLWAWVFTSINEVGRTLTNFANASFRDATDTQINRGNYVDYLHAASGILSMKLSDLTPTTLSHTGKYDTITILEAVKKDCISIPSSKAPFLSEDILDGVNKSGDIIRTLDGYFTKNELRLFKNPTDPTGNLIGSNIEIDGTAPGNYLVTVGDDTYRCKALWDNFKKDIEAINKEQGGICHGALYSYLTPENVSIFTGDRKTKVSAPQTNNIILQAAMINQFMEQKSKLPSEITFASGKSMAQITLNSAGTGFYMAKMLPYIQMSLRAVLYAFFPFIFIIMIFPYGLRVLGQYLRTLIWIELWMPIAAVLNMFIMFGISEKFKLLYDGAGMNIANSIQVFSESFIMAGVAGYLFAFVPAIAWMILKGSDQMLGRITANGLAQVAANFESQTINEDVRNLSRIQEYNNLRKQKGQELVSMAEQDMQRAEIKGKQEAGEYVANLENSDKLSLSAYGKKEEDLLKSVAKGNFLLSEEGGKNSITAKESMSLESNQEYLKSLGVLNENGAIDKDKLNAFAKSIGIEKSISDLTAQEFQNQVEVARRVQAGIIQKQKELGQNEGVKDALVAGLSAIKDHNAGKAQNLIKRIKSGDIGAISESFSLMAPYGEHGGMFNKQVADNYARALSAGGIDPNYKSTMQAGQFFGEVEKYRVFEEVHDKTENKKLDNYVGEKLSDNSVFLGEVETVYDVAKGIVDDIYNNIDDELLSSNQKYIKKSIVGMVRSSIISSYNQSIKSLTTNQSYNDLLNNNIDRFTPNKEDDKKWNQNFDAFFPYTKMINFAKSSSIFNYHSFFIGSPLISGSPVAAMISMYRMEGLSDLTTVEGLTNIPFNAVEKGTKKFISEEAAKKVGKVKKIKSQILLSGLSVGLMSKVSEKYLELYQRTQRQFYSEMGLSDVFELGKTYTDEEFSAAIKNKQISSKDKSLLIGIQFEKALDSNKNNPFVGQDILENNSKLAQTLENGILKNRKAVETPATYFAANSYLEIAKGNDIGESVMKEIGYSINYVAAGDVTPNTELSYNRIQELFFAIKSDSSVMNAVSKSSFYPAIQNFAEAMQNKDEALLLLNEMRKNAYGVDGADRTYFQEVRRKEGFLNNDKIVPEMLSMAFQGYVLDKNNINKVFKSHSESYNNAIEMGKENTTAIFTGVSTEKGYFEPTFVSVKSNDFQVDKNAQIAFNPNSSPDQVIDAVLNGVISATPEQIKEIQAMPVIAVQEISETLARMLYENQFTDPIQKNKAEQVLNILADIYHGRGTVLDERDIIGKDKWVEKIGFDAYLSNQMLAGQSAIKTDNVSFESNQGFVITKAISRIINDKDYIPTQYTKDIDKKNDMFKRNFLDNKAANIKDGLDSLLKGVSEKETFVFNQEF